MSDLIVKFAVEVLDGKPNRSWACAFYDFSETSECEETFGDPEWETMSEEDIGIVLISCREEAERNAIAASEALGFKCRVIEIREVLEDSKREGTPK